MKKLFKIAQGLVITAVAMIWLSALLGIYAVFKMDIILFLFAALSFYSAPHFTSTALEITVCYYARKYNRDNIELHNEVLAHLENVRPM